MGTENQHPALYSLGLREINKLFHKWLALPLGSFGVTIGEWTFLRALWELEGQSQAELSDRLGMTTAATVFSVNLLERDELAVRLQDRKDKRRYRIYLTPKGRELRDNLLPYAQEIYELALADFTRTEIDQLNSFVQRLKTNLERALEEQEGQKPQKPAKQAKARKAS